VHSLFQESGRELPRLENKDVRAAFTTLLYIVSRVMTSDFPGLHRRGRVSEFAKTLLKTRSSPLFLADGSGSAQGSTSRESVLSLRQKALRCQFETR
jgi:hypothetical protein